MTEEETRRLVLAGVAMHALLSNPKVIEYAEALDGSSDDAEAIVKISARAQSHADDLLSMLKQTAKEAPEAPF